MTKLCYAHFTGGFKNQRGNVCKYKVLLLFWLTGNFFKDCNKGSKLTLFFYFTSFTSLMGKFFQIVLIILPENCCFCLSIGF